ncbi:MAG: short chain dehydrogenase, partial [Myxococcales bacterium]|nr:short chain dehydrogenase [Myxococcales bacterium]
MSDFFLELSRNPTARKLIKTVGLPVPMPQALRRAKGPRQERPLHDQPVIFGSHPGGVMAPVMARTLARAGADVHLVGEPALRQPFVEPGEAYGRPARMLDLEDLPDGFKAHGMVFDATGLAEPGQLRALYDFFHPLGH